MPETPLSVRQGSTRVYLNDTIVVQNAYFVLTLTDKNGNVSVHNLRNSTTCSKWKTSGGSWISTYQK